MGHFIEPLAHGCSGKTFDVDCLAGIASKADVDHLVLCARADEDHIKDIHRYGEQRTYSKLPTEGLVQQRLFEVFEGGEFLAVDGFEALRFCA